MNKHLNAPFALRDNTVQTVEGDLYVEQVIEQVLFIQQGERVNRPTFGCGIAYLVFDPLTSPTAGVTEHLVQSQLQDFVGDVADILSVKAESSGSELHVTVSYFNKLTGKPAHSQYSTSTG
ncbi:MAG: GPW/gp25 family protein [Sneathiellales bacterium]|nr:GPW/gp25 family protein [Sneathiellales bacterium]